MTDSSHDIIVIGGGTAGLVTAAGAALLGAKVALVEREALGGDCLWTGCVPSKALIAFARQRRDRGDGTGEAWPDAVAWLRSARDRIARHDDPQRFRALGVDVIFSPARLAGPGQVEVEGRRLSARRIVLAMGSSPAPPAIAGLAETGFLTTATAFEQTTLPPSLIMLGGGPAGLELAQTYRRLGAQVTVLELLPEVLPKEDPEVAGFVRERLVQEGVAVLTGFRAARVAREGGHKVVYGADGRRVTADELFVATGRRPDTRDAEPGRAGVELADETGAVRVDARLRTSARGVWAAGDVTGGLQFSHVAEYMAKLVVRNALTPFPARADYRAVPWVTFTDPEVARVGLTAAEAEARGERVETFRYGFAELDRAVLEGVAAGFSKVVTRPNGEILGATLVGRGAGELIMELVLAMRHGIRLPALARDIHPYPTMAEIVKRTADAWYRTRYTGTRAARLVRRFVRWWL